MVSKTNTHVNIWPGLRRKLIVPSPYVCWGTWARSTLLRGRPHGPPSHGVAGSAEKGMSHWPVIGLGPGSQAGEGNPIPGSSLSHIPLLKTAASCSEKIPYKILIFKKTHGKLFRMRQKGRTNSLQVQESECPHPSGGEMETQRGKGPT